ncbi:Hsp20/alpha crystallin family protein [Hydrogenibacillus schlegelii]|uniref:SHSP domain-containing protein n=1 Tax=Hydrogenibacillus schlegelii TaxID=1484 RepID=A0A132NCG9_HYDSH|nr:Hsp20/alpha crystallin family protein [Hydrogenibacillus schlegelii]KWX07835.1 hypothetical protein TR75_01995 [Hydrogenibacillus schlegelii]OAR04928.1 hypothetical protein SA87_04415 [Hydrogenibacillus schlegelii]
MSRWWPDRRRRSNWPVWDDVEAIMERFFAEPLAVFAGTGRFRTDIRETEDAYIVEAELPGVDKDHIQIHYDDGVLSITVEEAGGVDEEREAYVRRERYRGRLERHFSLENVDPDGIRATYKNGLLTVTLPKLKRTPPKGRRIDIE